MSTAKYTICVYIYIYVSGFTVYSMIVYGKFSLRHMHYLLIVRPIRSMGHIKPLDKQKK